MKPSITLPSQAGGPAKRGGIGIFDMVSVALAMLFLFILLFPLFQMFRLTLFNNGASISSTFVKTMADENLLRVVAATIGVVGTSGFLAVAVAVCFAWLNERTDASIGWVSMILPFVPLLLPPVALSTGWFFLAHDRVGTINIVIRAFVNLVGIHRWDTSGPFNIATWQGLVFVYTLYLVPNAYLIVAATFRNMDPSLEEASRACGAGTWRTFRKISLPSVLPGIAAAALLVSITGLSQFSIPATIGTSARIDILSVRIVSLVRNYPPHIEQAVIISSFVMLAIGVMWLIQRWISRRGHHSMIGGKSSRDNVVKLGVWKWPARLAMIGYLFATSILPLFALFLVSLQRFWRPKISLADLSLVNFQTLFFGTGIASRALTNSIFLAVTGATLGILLATVLMLFVRQNRGRMLGALVDGATKAPGAVPHIVIGLAFIIALAGPPFSLGGSLVLLLMAYIVIYMPQAAISAGSGIDQISNEMLEASAVVGASKSRTFRRILLPLLRPSLTAGWALLFVVMLGDLTASALLAQGSNPVVGFVLYDIWDNGTFAQLATLASAVGFVSFIAVSLVLLLARPKRS